MFLIDDLLMSPFKGFMWIVKEIHNAAMQEVSAETDRLTRELGELYTRLERGEIDDDTFDQCEEEILDRLDELHELATGQSADDDEDDDEDDGPTTGVRVLDLDEALAAEAAAEAEGEEDEVERDGG